MSSPDYNYSIFKHILDTLGSSDKCTHASITYVINWRTYNVSVAKTKRFASSFLVKCAAEANSSLR